MKVRLALITLCCCIIQPPRILAQEPGSFDSKGNFFSDLNVSGSVRGGYWNDSRDLDDREDIGVTSLWLRATPELGGSTRLIFDGWQANSEVSDTGKTAQLRELYIRSSFSDIDVSLGRQILVWGRADSLNPTDNITPRDFTLLFSDDGDQRIGANMIKSDYYINKNLSLSTIWLPDFLSSTVPLNYTAGLTVNRNQDVDKKNSWALKLDQSGGSVDWSISYFDGTNLRPNLAIDPMTSTDISLSLQNYDIRVLGADFATNIGSYGLRAEMAYTRTEDTERSDPFLRNSFLYAVAGGDRTFLDYLNINFQLFYRRVDDFQDPSDITDPQIRAIALRQAILTNQLDETNYGFTARVSNYWLNQTLQAELRASYTWPRDEYVVRLKSAYVLNDKVKLTLGADWFRGDDNSFYGNLRSNSTVFSEIHYTF